MTKNEKQQEELSLEGATANQLRDALLRRLDEVKATRVSRRLNGQHVLVKFGNGQIYRFNSETLFLHREEFGTLEETITKEPEPKPKGAALEKPKPVEDVDVPF